MSKNYAKGLFLKKPSENAPSYVKLNASIKVSDFKNWLDSIAEEWVNLSVLESQDGEKLYAVLNNYKKEVKDDIFS
jgi:hypothetical protein